jgi:hypothetical protein
MTLDRLTRAFRTVLDGTDHHLDDRDGAVAIDIANAEFVYFDEKGLTYVGDLWNEVSIALVLATMETQS